jgi:hypothetical protein
LKERRFETAESAPDGDCKSPLLVNFHKKVRTEQRLECQIRQVKAIRAAARFSYLLFLLRALPESFFLPAFFAPKRAEP